MTAVFRDDAADKAETWVEQPAPFDRLEFAISDAAKGIARAASDLARARREGPEAPTPRHGPDVFHATMEARRALAQGRRRVEAAWEEAEAADLAVARPRQQGIDARGVARSARGARGRAAVLFEQAERHDAARGRAHAALDLFRADGQLNDRGHARAEVAGALKGPTGPGRSRARDFPDDARGLNFPGRMRRRPESAGPDAGRREAMAWRWWPSHGRVPCSHPPMRPVRAVGRECESTGPERASSDRVSAVLPDTSRASSAVGWMNGVPRMPQSRHGAMRQPMLDLKRQYWNCHESRGGPRRKARPYQVLGLELPTYDFWTPLQADPKELTQRLSTARNTG
jgi:hypothetical protein